MCSSYSLTLHLWERYCKWFGKMPVCAEPDTPGLPYLACIHSSEVARTSTH